MRNWMMLLKVFKKEFQQAQKICSAKEMMQEDDAEMREMAQGVAY
jgi:hypothetical protein